MDWLYSSSIYQHLYTAIFVLLSIFTIAMFYAAVSEKRPGKAVGNAFLSVTCVFVCLVRFGLIGR